MPKPRKANVIYYTGPGLPHNELAAAFADLGPGHPLWPALRQVLQQRLANATVAAAARDPNAPGRIEEIMDLMREIAALIESPSARKSR